MIDHNVGATTAKRLEIKRLDSDYFTVDQGPPSRIGAKPVPN